MAFIFIVITFRNAWTCFSGSDWRSFPL